MCASGPTQLGLSSLRVQCCPGTLTASPCLARSLSHRVSLAHYLTVSRSLTISPCLTRSLSHSDCASLCPRYSEDATESKNPASPPADLLIWAELRQRCLTRTAETVEKGRELSRLWAHAADRAVGSGRVSVCKEVAAVMTEIESYGGSATGHSEAPARVLGLVSLLAYRDAHAIQASDEAIVDCICWFGDQEQLALSASNLTVSAHLQFYYSLRCAECHPSCLVPSAATRAV